MNNPALPETTLFMLMSVDGKISTGEHSERDFDKDLPNVNGAKEGLHQYYELEQQTDSASFSTGKVMAKVGWNSKACKTNKIPVSFILVDNRPHLTATGIENLSKHVEKLYILTSSSKHPAHYSNAENVEVISHKKHADFVHLFRLLKLKGIDYITIQSGGEMNAHLLRLGLINTISVVVAPVLIGGRHTPTLIDGESLRMHADLQHVKTLELLDIKKLDNSYINLQYKVT